MWITRVSINNPVFATMVMVALCVLGLFAYVRLGVEQMPDIAPPVASVQISYPGAAPEAVEREITKRVESAVNRITSRSLEGRSETNVEFSLNAAMGRAMQDLRDRISAVQSSLPREARAPTVARYDNGVVGIEHACGCGVAIEAPGAEIPIRRLRHIAGNPNFGGEAMLVSLGRETLQPERLLPPGTIPLSTRVRLQDDQHVGPMSMIDHILATANPAVGFCTDLMDVNAGRVADGEAGIEAIGWEPFHLMPDVASGRRTTWAEQWKLHNALVLFNPAPVT